MICWRSLGNGCPQGDSNPCLSLERAPSWAARRWGRLLLALSTTQSKRAGEIVSFQSSIVNKRTRSPVDEKDVHFARSVHTDRVGHFNVTCARWACWRLSRQSGRDASALARPFTRRSALASRAICNVGLASDVRMRSLNSALFIIYFICFRLM